MTKILFTILTTLLSQSFLHNKLHSFISSLPTTRPPETPSMITNILSHRPQTRSQTMRWSRELNHEPRITIDCITFHFCNAKAFLSRFVSMLRLLVTLLDLVAPDPKAQRARCLYKRKNYRKEKNKPFCFALLIFTWLCLNNTRPKHTRSFAIREKKTKS